MPALDALATSETRFLPIFLVTKRKTRRNRVSSLPRWVNPETNDY
jgi:hypothetical protein